MADTETTITSYTTALGSAVHVRQVPASSGGVGGVIWRCYGCHDESDRPIGETALGDPVRIVSGAALAHSQTCRW